MTTHGSMSIATMAGKLSLAVFLTLASNTGAGAETTRYGAICDASAAVALDERHFVVADDERNKLFVYRHGTASPVSTLDLAKHLDQTGDAREADLEGAARVGDRVYFIGSHSNNDKGRKREDRHALFHLSLETGEGAPGLVVPKAKPWGGLLKALEKDPRYVPLSLKAAAKLSPKTEGGVSIEGLAATPEGGLLIGFRNPRSADHKAFVAPLENPSAVIDARARPRFGDLIALDLGKRGIRSIERVGDRYLIVAGPYVDAKDTSGAKDFALFSWSGKRGDEPIQLPANLADLGVEGLFASVDGVTLYAVSDDGREKVDGEDCKDAKKDRQGFRLRALPSPQ
jgi:hypothetical protein